jgi:hypothetical protein
MPCLSPPSPHLWCRVPPCTRHLWCLRRALGFFVWATRVGNTLVGSLGPCQLLPTASPLRRPGPTVRHLQAPLLSFLFCRFPAAVAIAAASALPLLPSQRNGLTLGSLDAIILLLDLACSTDASGQKVRAKVLLFVVILRNLFGEVWYYLRVRYSTKVEFPNFSPSFY